jgi:hypothetical protein
LTDAVILHNGSGAASAANQTGVSLRGASRGGFLVFAEAGASGELLALVSEDGDPAVVHDVRNDPSGGHLTFGPGFSRLGVESMPGPEDARLFCQFAAPGAGVVVVGYAQR